MGWPTSDRYRAVINSHDQRHVIQVDVTDPHNGDAVIYPKLPIMPGGTVSVDETRQVRRTLSLSVPTTPAGEPDSLYPVAPSDNVLDGPAVGTAPWGGLLHPSSGYELRPYRGILYQDGTEEYMPLGVFRLTKPNPSDQPGTTFSNTSYAWGQGASAGAAATGSGGITIPISGNDRSAVISRRRYQQPWVVNDGTDVGTAIQQLLNDRWPGVKYLTITTGTLLPAQTFGQDPTQNNDPWADCITMATAAGMELFFDEVGQIVLRNIDPSTSAPVITSYTDVFDSGTSEFYAVTQNLDETLQYNGVILHCTAAGQNPITVEQWDSDPTSPTYALDPDGWGQVPYIFETTTLPNPGLDTGGNLSQATAMAYAKFMQIRRAFNAPAWTTVPDGSVAPGDRVSLLASRLAIDDIYAMSSLTIPLDVTAAMTCVARPQGQTTVPLTSLPS